MPLPLGSRASRGSRPAHKARTQAQQAAEQLKQAEQTLEAMRHQQAGSEMGDMADKAAQLAAQQQDFEQRLRRNFGAGQGNQQTAQQMADEKQRMLDAWNQLQKQMQQAARDVAGTQPGVSKNLRDTMGKSQQEEIGTRMEWTEDALRRGLGQYAVMQEAPVTKSLNELRDELKKLEAESASQGGRQRRQEPDRDAAGAQSSRADPPRDGTTAPRRRARRIGTAISRGISPVITASSAPAVRGNRTAKASNPAKLSKASRQVIAHSRARVSRVKVRVRGKASRAGQGQQQADGQRGLGPRGGGGPYGGGYGVNNGPRSGYGGYTDEPFDATNFGGVDPRMGTLPPVVSRGRL